MNEETLFSVVLLSIALPLYLEGAHIQDVFLFFVFLLFGGIGMLGLIDDTFLESRLLMRLMGLEPEQNR